MKDLTPLQSNYLNTCKLLQTLGIRDDLFDGLFIEHAKSKNKKHK